jgi:glucokinase
MRDAVIGVDLGGTKIYTALALPAGELLAEVVAPTGADGGLEQVLAKIVATVRDVTSQAGPDLTVRALGIGAPGPLDAETGLVYFAPNLGWHNVPLKDLLQKALGLPVGVDNDANLAALGEQVFGAGRGVRSMVYITVSTGVGGGLILDGRIYHGAGGGAGEIGHTTIDPGGPVCGCGNRGCLEVLASGTAMARRAREIIAAGGGLNMLGATGGLPGKVTAKTVADAAAAGDPEALAILAEAGRALGIGVANVINLLNPELVVLGGGAMKAGPPLWQAMEEEVRRRALQASLARARLVPAWLGSRAGVLGAVALAARALDNGTLL